MEEKTKIFFGEIGEFLSPYVTSVKPEGEEQHFSVGIELDGFTLDDEGITNIILSPSEAKSLADEIIRLADSAYEANYNLLVHKTSF